MDGKKVILIDKYEGELISRVAVEGKNIDMDVHEYFSLVYKALLASGYNKQNIDDAIIEHANYLEEERPKPTKTTKKRELF